MSAQVLVALLPIGSPASGPVDAAGHTPGAAIAMPRLCWPPGGQCAPSAGLLMPDHTRLEALPPGWSRAGPTVCAEIKPKCGFLPSSAHISAELHIKRTLPRFVMHQVGAPRPLFLGSPLPPAQSGAPPCPPFQAHLTLRP